MEDLRRMESLLAPVKKAQAFRRKGFFIASQAAGAHFFTKEPAMKEAIVREGWGNWLVIVGTRLDNSTLVKLEITDRFKTLVEATQRAELTNYLFHKCAEFTAKQRGYTKCAI